MPFFYCLAIYHAYAECRSDKYDETVQLHKVHDGDTFKLTDGRKVRIIGINTPEHARDNQPAEPYALHATQALKQLLENQPHLKLRYGAEKQDRYGRLLAHVFLNDDRNVSELMLQKGMAQALVVPPNLLHVSCYQQAEQAARLNQRGLWQHPRYQIIDAQQLSSQHRGYYRVKGTVQRVGESRSAYWLNLDDHFALKIKKSDSHYFTQQPIKNLQGQQLVARGWIYISNHKNRDELRMRIRHPSALDVVE